MPFLVGVITPQDYGAVGNGTTDDTTAINNALTASGTSGTPVFFPPATYLISAPLVVPSNAIVDGPQGLREQASTDPAPVATIKLAASFAGSGAFVMNNNTGNQRLRYLNVDGTLATGSIAGIFASGNIHDVFLDQIHLYKLPGNGMTLSVASGSSPMGWTATSVTADTCGVAGFSLTSASDCTFVSCEATANGNSGWVITSCANTHFTSCRAEFSTQSGYSITGSWTTGNGAGGAIFTGCSTDRNGNHGFSITSTGTAPIFINGALLRRDGSNGTGIGMRISSATTPVILSSIVTYPGVNDDGTGTLSPVTAMNVTGSTYVTLDSGWIHGATNNIVNGGSNTVFRVNPNIGLATGSTASPTFVYNNPWGTDNGSTFTANLNANDQTGVAITQAATFTNVNNPLLKLTTGSSATDSLIKASVSGDANSRYVLGVDGKVSMGPGNATQDTNIYRSASGILKTDNAFQATTGLRLNTTSVGNSVGAFALADATTPPNANPSGGGIMWSASGVPQWRASDGGVYSLAPISQFAPAEHGFAAWAYDPAAAQNGTILVSGTIYLSKIVLRTQTTLAKAYISVTTAASGVTANQNFLGLYDSSGTRQAVTTAGAIDAALASTGILTGTFSASYNAPPGTYWVALVNNATTPATVGRASGFQSTPNANLATAALRFAVNGTGTTLPATITTSSNSATNNITYWAAVSS